MKKKNQIVLDVSHHLHRSNNSFKIKNSLKNIISSIKNPKKVTTPFPSLLCCPIRTHSLFIDSHIKHLKPARLCKNFETEGLVNIRLYSHQITDSDSHDKSNQTNFLKIPMIFQIRKNFSFNTND